MEPGDLKEEVCFWSVPLSQTTRLEVFEGVELKSDRLRWEVVADWLRVL